MIRSSKRSKTRLGASSIAGRITAVGIVVAAVGVATIAGSLNHPVSMQLIICYQDFELTGVLVVPIALSRWRT